MESRIQLRNRDDCTLSAAVASASSYIPGSLEVDMARENAPSRTDTCFVVIGQRKRGPTIGAGQPPGFLVRSMVRHASVQIR
jgi:hypothetical protein